MTNLPIRADVDYQAGEPAGPYIAALLQWYDNYLQQPGVQAAAGLTIAIGSVTPTMGVHTIDTEGALGADDLTHIDQTNIPDGAFLIIRSTDAARVVTVKHGALGAGQVLLTDSADFVLDNVDKWLWLRRSATDWVEQDRFYASDTAAMRASLGLGNVSNVKDNLTAALAPTVNDDSAVGYAVGSTWMDVTNNSAYICLDATVAAAVWSEITAVSSGATAAEKADIAQNGFLIASHQSLAAGNIANGWRDVFTDQTGVNTVTSTNEVFDAVNYLYQPVGGYSADLTTSLQSISGGDDGTYPKENAFDDDLTGQWRSSQLSPALTGAAYIGQDFGVGVTKHIRRIRIMQGTVDGEIASVKIQFSDDGIAWTTHSTVTIAASSAWQTLDLATSAAHRYWRLLANGETTFGVGGQRWWVTEIEMMEFNPPSDMTLVSNAATALSAPTSATIMLWEEDIDAVIPNTDLKASASRDSGVTWTQIILMISATLTTGRLLTGTVDISAQPAGTAMTYKIETLNAKSMKFLGIQLSWS